MKEFQFGSTHFRVTPNPQGVSLHYRVGNDVEWKSCGQFDSFEWAQAHAAWMFHPSLHERFAVIARV